MPNKETPEQGTGQVHEQRYTTMYLLMGGSLLLGFVSGITLLLRTDALFGEAVNASQDGMHELATEWLRGTVQIQSFAIEEAAEGIEEDLVAFASSPAAQRWGESHSGEAAVHELEVATRTLARHAGVRAVAFYDASLTPVLGAGAPELAQVARTAFHGSPGRLVGTSGLGERGMGSSVWGAVPVGREGAITGVLVVDVAVDQLARAWRRGQQADAVSTTWLVDTEGALFGEGKKLDNAILGQLNALGSETVVQGSLDSAARRVSLLGGSYYCVVETGQPLWRAKVTGLNSLHVSLRWLLAVCTGLVVLAMVTIPIWLLPRIKEFGRSSKILMNAVVRTHDGDFTVQVDDPGTDEMAAINKRFGEMIGNLRSSIAGIKAEASGLAMEAVELTKVAEHMVAQTKDMSSTTMSVAGTTDEISSNVHTVAAAIEQSSTNVRSVAAAVDEISANLRAVASNAQDTISSIDNVNESIRVMTGVVGEVSSRSQKATGVMARAIDVAKRTSSTIGVLGQSANEIGRVVSVINDIADKTNLLALNATIEAASAGEAGRGFAVVANEVKELAKQTARATEEIRHKIEGIQADTRESVGAISEIVRTIDEVNVISGEITAAVQLQSEASRTLESAVREASNSAQIIQRSAHDASAGANEVAHHAEELAAGSNSIARSAAEVAAGSQELSKAIRLVSEGVINNSSGAQHFNMAATQLASVTDHIARLLNHFST